MTLRIKILTLLHSLLPVTIAGLIYVAFRSVDLKMFDWFYSIGLEDAIQAYRDTLSPTKQYIPNWIYLSLPNALWVYSFTSSLIIIWSNQTSILKYWLVIPFALGVIVEFLQYINIIRGTFDIVDLSLSLIGWILSIVIVKSKIKSI